MSKKAEPCLHCLIHKAIDDTLLASKIDPTTQETQRWVLHSLSSVVADRITTVNPTLRTLALTDFVGQMMAYVEAVLQEELAPPSEGERVH